MNHLMVRLAEMPQEFPQVRSVRQAVFQQEQGVAPELEFDGQDEAAQHLLAFWDHRPVGTTRIRLLGKQSAKIERVAVLSEARGLGIGKQLMEKAFAFLQQQQVREAQVHAQLHVQDFYEKLGFVAEGAVFLEAEIPHVKMKKRLGDF